MQKLATLRDATRASWGTICWTLQTISAVPTVWWNEFHDGGDRNIHKSFDTMWNAYQAEYTTVCPCKHAVLGQREYILTVMKYES